MKLYQGTTERFITDVNHNEIADLVKDAFVKEYGYRPSQSEYNSWAYSSQFMKNLLQENNLYDNEMVMEYQIPYSSQRIDCVLFGKGKNNEENVVIIELKQWSNVKDCEIEDNVITFVGGRERMEAHPSIQVRGYHYSILDFKKTFDEEPKLDLHSLVYCHNYTKKDNTVLFDKKFETLLNEFPVFTKDDFVEFGIYLKEKLQNGKGIEIFNRFENSQLAPSKKLVDVTGQMIKGQQVFNLIDEQLTANNTIIDRAKKSTKLAKKAVIIIKGGPGTGKSVIALNAMAELLKAGTTVFHATGSAAFTKTLRKIVGSRSSTLFKFFNSFSHKKWTENEVNVLICDEAHRIRKTSNSRYTPASERSEIPQIEELIRVAKVSIFFLDEYQIVRPEEIGSIDLIKETAGQYNADVYEFELQTQFRCNGSEGYLSWVDNLLGIRHTMNTKLTKEERVEFKLFDSPDELYQAIVEKNSLKPNSARLVAGFCWPWSNAKPDGTLVNDVKIGDFEMSWEAKDDSAKLSKGIPKASLWAYDPNGVNQIGTVYTVQGFEFDYIGVIFGGDIIYNAQLKQWIAHPERSYDSMVKKDRDGFLRHIQNVYRVLMTRGMKGCYVYIPDNETREYVKSLIDTSLF